MDNTFLQQTARSIIDHIDWNRLSQITIVLPSHRAGVVLKDEIMRIQHAQQAKAIWAPKVTTLTQLQDTLSPLYSEDELKTIVRLYKHYRRLNAQSDNLLSLDLFYVFGKQMIADFTNIDASMAAEEVPNFFANTIAAHELSQFQLDDEVRERLQRLVRAENDRNTKREDSIQKQYETIWRQLYELYKSLRTEMEAEQKGYAGMRQRAVIEQWQTETIQDKISQQTYYFVGFNYLLPVERELMEKMRDAKIATFYWDFVQNFQTNKKAFSFAEKNSALLGNSSPRRHWDTTREVTVVSCVSKEAQAQYVHQWLQANYTAHGQKVGVVICDESMLEPVVYTLPAITLPGMDSPQPINITKGFPLRNTQIYSQVLRWFAEQPKTENDKKAVSPEKIDELLTYLFPPSSNAEDIHTTQNSISWHELLVLESEYQVRTILNKMRLLIVEGLGEEIITFKLLRLLVRRMMESVSMPFHGEPVTDIQIMGVLETRMLDFDRLLLLNVEEGIVPQKQADMSFIPYYLRKAYHMQTPDERATVYAYNFFRLLSRAEQTTLLFGAAESLDGGKGISRFIMQILVSPEFIVHKQQLHESGLLKSTTIEMEDNLPSMLSLLRLNEKNIITRENGLPYTLSPSALNMYIRCPRSFYFHYILGLKKPEEEEIIFAPNTLGSFVHYAMEYIYKYHVGCRGTKAIRITAEQIQKIIDNSDILTAALDYAYEQMNIEWEKNHTDETDHYTQDQHRTENVQIKEYIKNILERDKLDAASNTLSIQALEARCIVPLDIDGVGQIQIGGIIDRLDTIGDGDSKTLRVIDYKSGSYNDKTHATKMSATWEELMNHKDKGYVRQTMIYSYAVEKSQKNENNEPIEPHLYFCSHKLTDIETTISLENGTISNFAKHSNIFREQLSAKAKELLTTNHFPQCAEEDCPMYCAFFKLCNRKPKEY